MSQGQQLQAREAGRRNRRFLTPVVLVVCGFLLASTGAAFAYWTATGSGSASATATTLGAGNQPSATVSGRDVSLSWTAATNATTYIVARTNVSPGSLLTTLSSTCAGSVSGTSCKDPGLPDSGTATTTWTYTDTPHNTNWVGATSAPSATVTIPGPTLSVGSSSATSAGGTASNVAVANYFDNETVTYCVDNDTTTCPAGDQTSPATASLPASGGAVTTTTLTLPAGLAGGSHTLYANGSSGSDPTGVPFNVTKVTPTITTSASPSSATVGGSVDDQATVSSGYNPTGTITWSLYASTDTTCSGTVYFSTSSGGTVSGNSTYTSSYFTTTAAGSYKWGFSYSGDSHNNSVSACGGSNESLTVNKATPTLSTNATATVSVGGTVTDTATLANGYIATGTITYTLYGPSSTQSCTTQVGQVTSSVTSGTTVYTSPSITPPSGGTYWWIANYGGDSNNQGTTNGCGQSGESSVVNPVTPTITTNASPASVTVGGSAADQATFSGLYNPTSSTGTITWKLYASTDTNCTGTVFFTSSGQSVTANTTYTSSSFPTTAAGTYKWGFSYTGDTSNNPVSACGGTNENLTVNKATPTFSTTASPANVASGSNAADQMTLSGGFGTLGGSVTYTLYAPSDSTCSGSPTPLTATGSSVSGTGTYTSGNVAPTTTGTWHWIATYSGDANNNGLADPCSGTGSEPVTVYAADGSGTLTTPTTTVVASSTGNTITFTYTAATGGMSNGEVDLTVPSGWTTPVSTNAIGCTTVSGGTLAFSGLKIEVSALTLSAGSTLTITYGATSGGSCTSGDGAKATSSTGAQTWPGQQKSLSGDTAANISPSPSITVVGAATKLVLTAQTTTPTAGAADNLTITAEDSGGNTVTSYTGSKNLTFGGASVAPNGTTKPTVTNSSGTATNFGSTTAINFVSGQASVQTGGKNGVITLYDAQTSSITVSDGSINNGTGLSVTVAGAGPASLVLANCVVQATSQACNGTYKLGNGGTMAANVQALDTWGNGATISTAINMSVTSANTSTYSITAGSTLTIDGTATPPYQSTTTFTVQKLSNASNSTTITVHVTSSPSLSDLTFTVSK